MGFFDAFFKEHQRTKSEEIYDNALQIFNSPELQNQALSGELADKVRHGEDCDVLPGAYGRLAMMRPIPSPSTDRAVNSSICRACACAGRVPWSFSTRPVRSGTWTSLN